MSSSPTLSWLMGGGGTTRGVPVSSVAVACTIQFVTAGVPPVRVRWDQSMLGLVVSIARLEVTSRVPTWWL